MKPLSQPSQPFPNPPGSGGTVAFAIEGGTPRFAKPLYVGRPNRVDKVRLMERIEGLIDRGNLTNNGPLVDELETRMARRLGAAHCVALSSGTVALEIAARALDLDGEVILPSFTFVATAHALQWQRIKPVFCDIDPHTHLLDPAKVEAQITKRTSAILGVHLWSRPCDHQALAQIADRHNLKLFFDAAHALGAAPRRVAGAVEVYSLHATKFVQAFEGGLAVTDDADLAHKMRLMRNFGFSDYDTVIHVGTNGKMSEVSAAMGLTSLESMDRFVEVNRHNHRLYRDGLDGIDGVKLMNYDDMAQSNHQYLVVEIDPWRSGLTRDELVEVLMAENVFARRYFYPGCHRLEPYRSIDRGKDLDLVVTERVASRVMVLPTGTGIEPDQIRRVCHLIRDALNVAAAPRLKKRIRQIGPRLPRVEGDSTHLHP